MPRGMLGSRAPGGQDEKTLVGEPFDDRLGDHLRLDGFRTLGQAPSSSFVVRRVQSGPESEDTYVQRYDARGQPQWQPEDQGVYVGDCGLDCYDAPEANLAARSDGSGGVWIVDKIQVDVEIQHVDARGRPLYHLRRWKCEDDGDTVRAEIQAVDRDGGAAGLDAGAPLDATCPPPDGGLDAGLEAGADASSDAAGDAVDASTDGGTG